MGAMGSYFDGPISSLVFYVLRSTCFSPLFHSLEKKKNKEEEEEEEEESERIENVREEMEDGLILFV